MDTTPPISTTSAAAQPAADEAATRARLEAALAAAEARAASLERQLATAQAEAQRYQSQLTRLADALPMGLMLVNEVGQVELVNKPFRDLFGWATDSIAADDLLPVPFDAVHINAAFQDPPSFSARQWSLHEQGQTVLQEEFALANGRIVELDYVVIGEGPVGRLICYRDVTARRQRAAQQRSVSFIPQQNPNPVLRLSATGEVVHANPAATPLVEKLAAEAPAEWHEHLAELADIALHTARQHQRELAVAGQHYLCTAVAVPGDAFVTIYLTDITAWRRAEYQLAEQRSFYETILEQVPVALAVVDAEFRYLFANPAVEPDPGTREWMLGRTNEEYCRYRHRPEAIVGLRRAGFEQAVRERREVNWEEAFYDGQQEQHLLRQLRPIFGNDGKLRFVIGAGFDITDRKRAEQSIVQQREFYESILNYLPVDIAVFDGQHRYLFVNPSSISNPVLRQQIIGMTNAEYFTYRQRSTALAAEREQHFRQAVRTRADTSWEETLAGPNGTTKRVLRTLRAVFQADGALQLVVGSGIDITARYEAEERLRESETMLREQQAFIRQIVDTLPSVVYVIDEQGKVVFHNAAFDDARPRSLHQHAVQEQSQQVRAEVRQLKTWRKQVMASQQSLNAELPITTITGETCYLQVHMRVLNRANGHREVLVVSTDITNLKRAQQAADANSKAKEAFLARMSHEIRTPLNGVLGMAALLQKTPLAPEQQEYLATMQRAGQHLLALVNDVLDLAKITAHHLELEQTPFDAAVLLLGAGQAVAALATQKGIALTVEPLALANARVLGDAYRLHQVLLNLLSNAIKFTEQGSIRLGAAVLREWPATIALRFWVQDTGLGIAPEQQERIFESFAQASADTSSRFGGTGLGLTISEQLVRQMGGVLRLCSMPGEGTTFSFTLSLPRVVEAPAALPAPPSASYEGLRGLRVLLAEDNVVNQWIARVLLEFWGVQVETVGTGTEALARLTTQSFDAALLDIQMPGLSGVEVTTAIRQHPDPARAGIPIIALTANAFDTDRQHYLAVGMNGCVTKPFEEADLCQMLLRLTRGTPEAALE